MVGDTPGSQRRAGIGVCCGVKFDGSFVVVDPHGFEHRGSDSNRDNFMMLTYCW
jgi:hypothetical protein